MNKTRNIWTYRYEAKARLRLAAEYGGCHTFDLLTSGARSPIIKSLTAPDVARNVFGMRQASMQNRWRALVGLAADNPYALGFRKVERRASRPDRRHEHMPRHRHMLYDAVSQPERVECPSTTFGVDGLREAN